MFQTDSEVLGEYLNGMIMSPVKITFKAPPASSQTVYGLVRAIDNSMILLEPGLLSKLTPNDFQLEVQTGVLECYSMDNVYNISYLEVHLEPAQTLTVVVAPSDNEGSRVTFRTKVMFGHSGLQC